MLDQDEIKELLDGIIEDCILVSSGKDIELKDSFNDLGADSIDFVEIIVAVEEEFEIEIPDEDMDKIKTVEDLVNYVKENI